MAKTFLCDSCRFADVKIGERWTTNRASYRVPHKVRTMNLWCNHKMRYMGKLSRDAKCGYRPRAGKIGKHLTQTSF